MATFQKLSNFSLISETGQMETVYGEEISRLNDRDFLMESLHKGQEHIVTDGNTASDQLVIFATPLSTPMSNGESSIGLLWCESATRFAEVMDLENPDLIEHFHIIRRDTSYVTKARASCGTSFEENALGHALPEGMTVEDFINDLSLSGPFFQSRIQE